MKYNIHGFNQPRAVELNLSNDDLLVLRWFVDFAGTKKMKTIFEEDGLYYWVNYTNVLEDLPVLKISKTTLKRKHFDNLCKSNVLKHKHIKDGGSFSYYAYGINYDTLVYLQDTTPSTKLDYPSTKLDEGYDEIVQGGSTKLDEGVVQNCTNKDNSIINSSINNDSIKKEKKKYGEFKNVLLTEEEYEKIKDKKMEQYIDKLSIYIESKGNKYKSHYATILNWSRKEKEQKDNRPKTSREKMDEVFERFLNAKDEDEE